MTVSFVPASSGADSAGLLYKMLTQTDDDIVTRILLSEATQKDLEHYFGVCLWLNRKVRKFDFNIAEIEHEKVDDTVMNLDYNVALMANKINADRICYGYNTYNWSQSNWFFQTNDPIEKFYTKNNKYCWIDHTMITDYTDIPIHWVFLNREETPIGRWKIYESIPEQLLSLVSICECGQCFKCRCKNYYHKMKSEGKTADWIDNSIQKLGRYGFYWNEDTSVNSRHFAYESYFSDINTKKLGTGDMYTDIKVYGKNANVKTRKMEKHFSGNSVQIESIRNATDSIKNRLSKLCSDGGTELPFIVYKDDGTLHVVSEIASLPSDIVGGE
jgi:hypothetical protein